MRTSLQRLTFIAVAAFLACGTQAPTDIPPDAQRVAFEQIEEIHTPISGFADRERMAITDQETWEQVWSEFHRSVEPAPAVPEIDFSERMVLLATMGTRSSGGYGISIEGVFTVDGQILIEVLESSPGPTCVTTGAITHPATAVVTDRMTEPVEWVEKTRQTEC
jgi:predicted small lipoprotein YifL